MGPRSEIIPFEEVLEVRFGNVTAMPVEGTLHELPWAGAGKHHIGEVLCETYWPPSFRNGAKQGACSRHVAENQLQRLRANLGYRLYSSFEAEFMIFEHGTLKPIFDGTDIFANLRFAEFETFLYDVDEKLAGSGVFLETLQTEYAAGQFELVTKPTYNIEAADAMFCLKEGIKEMCMLRGWDATFMTKPLPKELCGNGMHFNMSIWSISEKKNLFYDATKADGISDAMRYWIAGLLKHSGALTALCSPTVNCYRRLNHPWAPGRADWGIDDRMSGVRVKNGGPEATYLENRIPGGSANPYLILAATVAAGMDGIVKRLECPPTRTDSAAGDDGTGTAADGVDQHQQHHLPATLSEALVALERDEVMADALGAEFVSWFVKVKREVEIAKLEGVDDVDLEQQMYFTFL